MKKMSLWFNKVIYFIFVLPMLFNGCEQKETKEQEKTLSCPEYYECTFDCDAEYMSNALSEQCKRMCLEQVSQESLRELDAFINYISAQAYSDEAYECYSICSGDNLEDIDRLCVRRCLDEIEMCQEERDTCLPT